VLAAELRAQHDLVDDFAKVEEVLDFAGDGGVLFNSGSVRNTLSRVMRPLPAIKMLDTLRLPWGRLWVRRSSSRPWSVPATMA